MLSAITLCLICIAIPLLCHLLNIFSLSTKEKACEALILLQVVQAGRWKPNKCVLSWRNPGKQKTHGRRDRADDGLWGGEHWGTAEVGHLHQSYDVLTAPYCLKFCLRCDHNSLQLLQVLLQPQPVEGQQLMQEFFILTCSPKTIFVNTSWLPKWAGIQSDV